MKIIAKLLLGLLLIAPGLQASEAVPAEASTSKTEEELKEEAADAEIAQPLAQAKFSQKLYIRLLKNAIKGKDIDLTKALITLVSKEEFNAISPHPIFNVVEPELTAILFPHVDPNLKCNEPISGEAFDQKGGASLLVYYCYKFRTHREYIEKLIAQKVDINAQDNQGKTALLFMTMIDPTKKDTSYAPSIVENLLNNGADPYIEACYNRNTIQTTSSRLTAEKVYEHRSIFDKKYIDLCQAQRPRRIAGLQAALYPYLTKDTAGVVIAYLPEGFEEEQVRQAKSGTLTKISE
jgi:ankyrin repeat protein